MSPVDTAWLRMDRENRLMAIKGVLVLERPLSLSRLRALLQTRLLPQFPRFGQRVRVEEGVAWWEHDARFAWSRHLRSRVLGAGEPEPALRRLLGEIAREPLDPHRPLWRIHLVPHYREGTALVVQVHHCMADGIALMGVLRALADPDASKALGACARLQRRASPGPERTTLEDGAAPAEALPEGLARVLQWLQDPQSAARLGHLGGTLAADLARLVVLPSDSPTRLKGRSTDDKRIAWSAPLALREVQAVAALTRGSVNDVLLACAAGALRRHLLERGDSVEGIDIRTLVPVNLRPRLLRGLRAPELGNRFGLVPLLLPLGLANPFARVQAVAERMRVLKHSLLPPLSLGLMGAMGLAPPSVQQAALELLSAKATAVMTHVPGPREPLVLDGIRVTDLMFWVPQSGDVGVGISVLAYGDSLRFGLITDAAVVPEPQDLMPLFEREFAQLLTGVLLLGGHTVGDPAALQVWLENRLAHPPLKRSSTAPTSSDTTPAPARRGRARPATSRGKPRA